jgi:hypothetical protein
MKNKLTLLALSSSLLLFGCYTQHRHTYARGPDVYARYSYVYYPDVEVYFEPHRNVYYWSEAGTWRSGPRVPQNIVLRSSVRVDLDSPEPYRHHEEVRAKHPGHKEEEEHERKHQDRDQQ